MRSHGVSYIQSWNKYDIILLQMEWRTDSLHNESKHNSEGPCNGSWMGDGTASCSKNCCSA